MARFHLRTDGNPGPCQAKQGKCPYGGDDKHFGSETEARQAYEASQGAAFEVRDRRMNSTYAGFDPSGAPDFTHSYEAFRWNSDGTFEGRLSLMQGFTGEHSDGEQQQFAIRGKSGKVMWMGIEDSVMCDDDMVDYWIVRPVATADRDVVREGRIIND